MDAADKETKETLDVVNIGARVFRRPAPTIRNAKTGEIVPPEKLARGLIAVAVLEHATIEGTKTREILCADCKSVVRRGAGAKPKRCKPCAKAFNSARDKERRAAQRAADPDGFLAKKIAQQAKWKTASLTDELKERRRQSRAAWRKANPEKRKALNADQSRRHRARKKASATRTKEPS